MGEEERNHTSIPELLEEILIRLSLKSILKCRAVSKQWRSILESRRFAEKRMSLQKNRKILAAFNCDCGGRRRLLPESRFEGDEEIVYLHCDARRPWISSCDGLLCFPEQDWIVILNNRVISSERWRRWFTPVVVSKQRNLVFHDNQKRLFKYYPETDEIRCLSLDTCVISPYVENLVPLPLKPIYSHPPGSDDFKKTISKCRLLSKETNSWIAKGLQWKEFRVLDLMFTSLVVAGCIWSPL